MKDCLDVSARLRTEVKDISKACAALQSRVSSFDSILHKENTDFKVSLLERKIQAVEQRIAKTQEEKSGSSVVINTLFNLPTPTQRPSTSKNRTSLHNRTMSYQNT